MPDPIEEFREDVASEIEGLALQYIEAILYFENYEKGNLHWRMAELLCTYVTGKPYDQYEAAGLLLYLHDKTQEVTDCLDEKIGFHIENKFRKRPRHELEKYADKLTFELCKYVLTLFPHPDTITAFKDKEPKPTVLKTPIRPPVGGIMLND